MIDGLINRLLLLVIIIIMVDSCSSSVIHQRAVGCQWRGVPLCDCFKTKDSIIVRVCAFLIYSSHF